MKNFVSPVFRNLCLMLALLLYAGCEHRPLEDMTGGENLFLRVYIDENIRNVTYGFYDEAKDKPEYSSPEILRVVMCDENDGKVITERYIRDCGRDSLGYYIQGRINAPNGRYNMLAYNFDTKEIYIRNEKSYPLMTAYTEPLSESEANRFFASRGDDATNICRQPDHLFVAKVEGIKVNMPEYWVNPDTIKTAGNTHPTAQSIVKTYYLQFNVKGVEYVRSAVALISGMAGSKKMNNGKMVEEDAASIFFSLKNGKEKYRTSDETAVAYASFNTFGKLPNTEGYLDVTFEFNTIYNTVQTETFRITDIFETDMAKENQWIIIDKVIEIVPPEDVETGGGISPGVNDWEQIEGGITI